MTHLQTNEFLPSQSWTASTTAWNCSSCTSSAPSRCLRDQCLWYNHLFRHSARGMRRLCMACLRFELGLLSALCFSCCFGFAFTWLYVKYARYSVLWIFQKVRYFILMLCGYMPISPCVYSLGMTSIKSESIGGVVLVLTPPPFHKLKKQ